jgi:hypothetical protein
MGAAQWALVISGVAVAISLVNLWWNIRSRFIHPKPRLGVRLEPYLIGGAIDPDGWRIDNSPRALGRGCRRQPDGTVIDTEGQPVKVTSLTFATLSVTNFGPNDVILDSLIVGRSRGRWGRLEARFPSPFVLPSPDMRMVNDYETVLPQKLEVGDSFTIEFPINDVFFDGVSRIGILDTFGRNHWCAPEQVEVLRGQLRGRQPK